VIDRKRIPIDQLRVDPIQSRDRPWTGDEDDRQLVNSIGTQGLMQDLIVRPINDESPSDGDGGNYDSYAIVAGSRRYHAAMEAGHEEVPCKVFDADDLDAAWTSLTENTTRKELSEQEIAEQLKLIYEFVRPTAEPDACPRCGTTIDGEAGLHSHYGQTDCTPPSLPSRDQARNVAEDPIDPTHDRFTTDRQAKRYLASRFLGRTDDGAIDLITGHLRTAELPQSVQALFKRPSERSETETTALRNYAIDTKTTLGSGDGHSGTSREVIALFDTFESEFADAAVDPTDAVLESIGSLHRDEMSEQELRRTLRDFRHGLVADADASLSPAEQQQLYTETLQTHAEELQSTYEEVEPNRPFKRVDVLGPETQRHSRWHARARAIRDASGHGDLVRQLYHERLETLAEEEGWS